jgi:phosphate transport system substrate-binding protein
MKRYVMIAWMCLIAALWVWSAHAGKHEGARLNARLHGQGQGQKAHANQGKKPGQPFRVAAVLDDFTTTTYPRVDGSTSAQPLQLLIACRILGAECAWWSILGSGGEEAYLRAIVPLRANVSAEHHKKALNQATAINNRVFHRGTHKSYENLIQGGADLILVARQPSEDELKLAKEKGVELDVQPVALDAFVFIENRENPVSNLTTEQIRNIYSGKIKNWKDLGGPDRELHPYQRERNSGSQELMQALVMKGLKPIEAPEVIILGMAGPFNRLTQDKQGLAYSVFFYEQRMAISRATKLIAVDGIMPTTETIRARAYPYVSEVYVVIRRGMEERSPARRLRDWLLSDEGQAVVTESGYVPVSSK